MCAYHARGEAGCCAWGATSGYNKATLHKHDTSPGLTTGGLIQSCRYNYCIKVLMQLCLCFLDCWKCLTLQPLLIWTQSWHVLEAFSSIVDSEAMEMNKTMQGLRW